MSTTIEPVHILARKWHEENVAKAKLLAADFGKIEDATTQLVEAVRLNDEAKLTLAYVHRDLFSNLEVAGIDAERLSALPRPGTYEGHVGDNVPFDIYKYKDAEGKPKRASFWDMVAESYDFVIDLRRQIDALDKNEVMPKHEQTTQKSALQSKITTFRQKLKDAVALYFAMEDANTTLGAVITVDYAKRAKIDDKGKPVIDPKTKKVVMIDDFEREKCIWVHNNADATAIKPFSIRNFLRLVAQEGQTYEDFITSNKREGDEKTTVQFKIESPVGFEQATTTFLQYLNGAQQSHNQHLWKSTLNHLATGSDDALLTFDAFYDKLTLIKEDKKIKARLDALDTASRKDAA